ncbi:proprotein convertase P-domain-containing protein [Maribacter sp.]|nr:proprotein convertase P-domain-containing protein [Maribacter sp.]
MKIYHFKNEQLVPISDGAPNQISSAIAVQGTGGNITDVNVKLDISHSYTRDLEIRLTRPDGTTVLLVNRMGGSGDDFNETTFDDNATIGIGSGTPPFNGVFKPVEALDQFNGTTANGVWSLEVADRAIRDGGALNAWELEIITDEAVVNTGPFIFHNRTPSPILATGVTTIESPINVQGLGAISVDMVCVTIDLEHTYTADLKISIVSPDNKEVVLVESEGSGGDNFSDTTFDDSAPNPITAGSAPFTGSFRPEGNLADFDGIAPTGIWKLVVKDQANLDGGVLKSWTLAIKSDATPEPESPFKIEVNFLGGLSDSQKAIFQVAADRWSEIIVGNLPPITTDIGLVDDLVIDAEGIVIDGAGGTLGQAGPTRVRPGSLLPARGIMQFDSADLQRMEDDGSLTGVIIHEMAHVLGIGTLWSDLGLVRGAGTNNPEFSGANAMQEYATLKNFSNPTFVPLANTGGAGTREGHWRESVFDRELMTGYVDVGQMPLSRLTVASLQDIGYQVDYNKADSFILPFALLSMATIAAKTEHKCMVRIPAFEVLPEENLMN